MATEIFAPLETLDYEAASNHLRSIVIPYVEINLESIDWNTIPHESLRCFMFCFILHTRISFKIKIRLSTLYNKILESLTSNAANKQMLSQPQTWSDFTLLELMIRHKSTSAKNISLLLWKHNVDVKHKGGNPRHRTDIVTWNENVFYQVLRELLLRPQNARLFETFEKKAYVLFNFCKMKHINIQSNLLEVSNCQTESEHLSPLEMLQTKENIWSQNKNLTPLFRQFVPVA